MRPSSSAAQPIDPKTDAPVAVVKEYGMQQAVAPSPADPAGASDTRSSGRRVDTTTLLFLVLATSVVLVAVWWLITGAAFLTSSVAPS